MEHSGPYSNFASYYYKGEDSYCGVRHKVGSEKFLEPSLLDHLKEYRRARKEADPINNGETIKTLNYIRRIYPRW